MESESLVWEMMKTLYHHSGSSDTSGQPEKGWRRMDPGLIWYINTVGCRQLVMSSIMGEENIESPASENIPCCDICMTSRLRSNSSHQLATFLHGMDLSMSYAHQSLIDVAYNMCATDKEIMDMISPSPKLNKACMSELEKDLRA